MRFLGRLAKFWLVFTFLGVGVYFSIYNQEHVGIELPPWIQHISLPGYIIYLTFFVAGAGVMSVFFAIDHFKKMLEIRQLNRRLRELGEDKSSVRRTPRINDSGHDSLIQERLP